MNEKIKKIKVSEIDIIVTGTVENPYFSIRYKEIGRDYYNIGFGSYYLSLVFKWRDEKFEVVNEENEIDTGYQE